MTGQAGAAVIGAVASEPRLGGHFSGATDAGAGTDFWSLLVNAQTSDELCRAWLGILCQWVPGTQAGLLLLQDEGERFSPAAVWPDPERDMSYLAPVAEQAIVDRRGVVRDESSGLAQCAYPLLSADLTYGVVVLHVAARGEVSMREALRLLHWGAGWLVGLFDRRRLLEREQRLHRSALLQDLLLGVLAEQQPESANLWVVNRVAEALPCRRAMLGRLHGNAVRVASISGTAGFEPHSNLLALAREALQDAFTARAPLAWPDDPAAIDAAALSGLTASPLADYCREAGAAAVLVLPLVVQGRAAAALLLDFDAPIGTETREFCQTLALALAPALDLHQRAARGLSTHAREWAARKLRLLTGPRHPGMKLAGGLALVALLLAYLVPVTYRVHAPATVEGSVQRSAVAPFDGFIAAAPARAGDRVSRGDVLARLDDRDLQLESAKLSADSELAERKLREAMAKGSAVAVRLAQADADQSRAELALLREKLSRVVITAPFDGIVVRGDLSQQLGAPVEQGKLLFEVAPLDAYRVVLKVDERDIAQVRQDAAGELVLAGLPGERFVIRVSKLSPVAAAEDGRNNFRVEAQVQPSPSDQPGGDARHIQPGLEGVAKVVAGEHSLLWVVFHRLFDWMRYTAWSMGL